MMSNLTNNQRLQIITLRKNTFRSVREIADDLNVTKSAVGRVVKSYEETGSHESQKSLCGRHRATTEAEDRMIVRISKRNPHASSVDIQGEMSAFGTNLSERTVSNRLTEAGRSAYKPIPCQVLTDNMKAKRLQWAKDHQDWTIDMWRSVS